MGKNAKDLVLSVSLLTLYSLKWWHHLEPAAPSTSYRIWEQVKWRFFHSSKDQCVSNQTDTENARKRSSDLGAWWGFDLPDLTANEYNSESPVSFGHVPCKWNSQASISQGKGFQLVPTWACFQTESKQTHCGIWKRSPVSAVSLGTPSICVSLYCLQVH